MKLVSIPKTPPLQGIALSSGAGGRPDSTEFTGDAVALRLIDGESTE